MFNTRKILSIIFLFILVTASAFAGKYKIPKDEDVMVTFNDQTSEVYLYPFSINILVWNIYKGANKSWKSDFYELSNEKDILMLQEVYLNTKMKDTFSFMDWFHFSMATAWIDKKDKHTASGVGTATKGLPFKTIWQRSHYREPVIKTPKMTLFTKYKLAGVDQELLVGNIHAINFVRAFKLRHMLDEAAKVMAVHDGPAIFAGDFNTWTKTKINNMNKVFKQLGYVKVAFENDYRKAMFGNVLDYAWVKNLKVLESKVPRVKGSDHAPMTMELSIY
jgi:endonuclease/exonuclease/phosphatase (EEP) superfamily protein YafD